MGNLLLKVESMSGCEVYRIGAEAVITLQPSTGYVSVSCPWHDELNGCHYWRHRGEGVSLVSFLFGLDRHYAMKKLFNQKDLQEFDLEETVDGLKRMIIDQRRSDSWPADVAREIWDDVVNCETPDDVARLSDPYGNCYYEDLRYKDKDCVAWFWDVVWASFIAHLKETNHG